jgi:flagellar FliL protein
MSAATVSQLAGAKATAEAGEAAPKKSRKKLFIIVGVLVLALGGFAAKTFVLAKPKPKTAASTAPQPGDVLTLDPITINLTDSHYLRLGLALQLAKGVDKTTFDGSAALDAAIGQLSGGSEARLGTNAGREAAKQKLTATVTTLPGYTKKVLRVYFTDFVMQ